MEETAKRIGKFNIVDIIAVILIVAVVAFVGWKLLSRGSVEAGETAMTNVTYTVKVEGVPAELYETCQAHLPSPLMASGELVGGQIESGGGPGSRDAALYRHDPDSHDCGDDHQGG